MNDRFYAIPKVRVSYRFDCNETLSVDFATNVLIGDIMNFAENHERDHKTKCLDISIYPYIIWR